MASFRETTAVEQSSAAAEDEDVRGGEGKKKKFKPLSAVRKLFGGGRKRKKEDSAVVAVKAQSTTALHTSSRYRDDDDDEDDDDGGFKGHQQKPLGLAAGTRSLSEDSVFSPDQTTPTIVGSFPQAALSVESLPKSAFQSELFSKLNKRRSQYSDDDRDDGLPRSPVPPVTTADVILGDQLKPPGKKSSNRDSDQSLISVDSSENEEDKLFETNWKSAVPSIRARETKQSNTAMEPLDFNSIQKTELLTSGAAKDRISIKPQSRKASRHSRNRRSESNNSPQSLPSLNEESPTSPVDSPTSTDWPSGNKYSKTTAATKTSSAASSLAQSSPVSPVTPSSKTVPTLQSPASPAQAATASSSPTAVKLLAYPGSHNGASSLPTGSSTSSTNSEVEKKNKSAVVSASSGSEKKSTSKVASQSSNSSGRDTASTVTSKPPPSTSPASTPVAEETPYGSMSLKSRMSQFQQSSNSSSTTQNKTAHHIGGGGGGAGGATFGLKASEPGVSPSNKGEDYKLKRQNRSKTLPGAKDEVGVDSGSSQSSPNLQRANSQKLPGPDKISVAVLDRTGKSQGSPEKTAPVGKHQPASITPASSVGKLGSRFAAFENKPSNGDSSISSSSSTGGDGSVEPAWKNMVKRRKDGDADGGFSSSSSGPSPRSVFSSAAYLDKKRNSLDTSTSSGSGSDSRTTSPRDTAVEAVREDTPRSQGKRESIEISVEELGSTSRGTTSSTKTSSVSSPLTASTASSSTASSSSTTSLANKTKPFSGAASGAASTNTSTNTTGSSPFKSGGNVSPVEPTKEQTSDTGHKPNPWRSTGAVSHGRSGSVKTSPTKTAAASSSEETGLKPWQTGRASSVKVKVSPAFLASSAGPAASVASVSKPSVSSATSTTAVSHSTSGSNRNNNSNSKSSNNSNNNNTSLSSSQSVLVTATSSSPNSPPTSLPSQTSSSPTRSLSVKNISSSMSSDASNVVSSKPPLATSAFGVKSSGVKSVSFSSKVKPIDFPSSSSTNTHTSTSIHSSSSFSSSSSTSPRGNASVINVASSSSSSSSTPTSSSTPLSTSQSNMNKAQPSSISGRTHPIRAHASFNHPSSVKPAISSSPSSSINKSPSMRVTPSSSSTSSSSSPSMPGKITPIASTKRASVDEGKKAEQKAPSNVPAWRANLLPRKEEEKKIEIIESKPPPTPSSTAPSSQRNKSEVVLRKTGQRGTISETAKKTETSAAASSPSEKLNNRSSRVLDMVKNFQNLQVST